MGSGKTYTNDTLEVGDLSLALVAGEGSLLNDLSIVGADIVANGLGRSLQGVKRRNDLTKITLGNLAADVLEKGGTSGEDAAVLADVHVGDGILDLIAIVNLAEVEVSDTGVLVGVGVVVELELNVGDELLEVLQGGSLGGGVAGPAGSGTLNGGVVSRAGAVNRERLTGSGDGEDGGEEDNQTHPEGLAGELENRTLTPKAFGIYTPSIG